MSATKPRFPVKPRQTYADPYPLTWRDRLMDAADDWFPTLVVVAALGVTMIGLYFFLPYVALRLAQ